VPLGVALLGYLGVKPFSKSLAQKYRAFILHNSARLLLRGSGIKLIVKGKQYLQSLKDRPCIIYLNHQSRLDPYILFAAVPFALTVFRSNKDHLASEKRTFFLRLLTSFDLIYLHDKDDIRVTTDSFGKASRHLRDKGVVATFPEGRVTSSGVLGKFGDSCSKIAIENSVPLLPVVIDGSYALFEGNNKRYSRGNVSIDVLEPIGTEGLAIKNSSTLSEQIRKLMQKHL
jgi:1-acyl-sn-glycerol-3-phosphate acyltransferase